MSKYITRLMTPLYATLRIRHPYLEEDMIKTLHFIVESSWIAKDETPWGSVIFDLDVMKAYIEEQVDKYLDLYCGDAELNGLDVEDEHVTIVEWGTIGEQCIDIEEGGCEENEPLRQIFLNLKPVSGVVVKEWKEQKPVSTGDPEFDALIATMPPERMDN